MAFGVYDAAYIDTWTLWQFQVGRFQLCEACMSLIFAMVLTTLR